MSGPSQRRPWTEGPAGDAPSGSWLALDDDELLSRIETLDERHDQDDRLLDVVSSDRHFFVRQEAAKRVRDRSRLFAFEGDRHIGQILVRHLTRREDVDYLQRLSSRSHHVEVRSAAQVQLARLWRRLETAGAPPPAQPATSAALAREGVDGSLLGWAVHLVLQQLRSRLGTEATRELVARTRRDLVGRHPTLAFFDATEQAQVSARLEGGLRLPREAVPAVAAWVVALREAVRELAPEIAATSVRSATAPVGDALRDTGFYAACDEAEAGLRR